MRRWAWFALKAAVSIGMLALLVHRISWDSIAARMQQISIAGASLALPLLLASSFFVALRWRAIAGAVARPMRVTEAWAATLVGTALDQVLITLSGDAYRVWRLNQGSPSLGRAVAGVFLDRVAGVLGIVALIVAFQPRLLALPMPGHLIWVPAALALAVLCAFALLLVLDRWPGLPTGLRWLDELRALAASARAVFLGPRVALPVLAAAVAVHLCVCVAVAVLAPALEIRLGLLASLTVVPTVMLITLLPISIGGWGVREGAMVIALGAVGVRESDALLISVLYGLGWAVVGALGALLWLAGRPVGRSP